MYKYSIKLTILGLTTAAVLLASIIAVSMSAKSSAQILPSQIQSQNGQITVNGAGSTFIFPLMDTWRVEYQKVKPGVNINYQSIGSGGGVKQFTAKTVDFGASDAPLSIQEQQNAPGAVHIPATTEPIVTGICTAPGAFCCSCIERGASEAPKSTVLAVNCLTPPPLPIDW